MANWLNQALTDLEIGTLESVNSEASVSSSARLDRVVNRSSVLEVLAVLIAKCLEVFELHNDDDLDDQDFQTALRTLVKHPDILLPRELPLLHYAVHNTQQAVVRFILRQEGSNIYQLDKHGNTALNCLLARLQDEITFSKDFAEDNLIATATALLNHEKNIVAPQVRHCRPLILTMLRNVILPEIVDVIESFGEHGQASLLVQITGSQGLSPLTSSLGWICACANSCSVRERTHRIRFAAILHNYAEPYEGFSTERLHRLARELESKLKHHGSAASLAASASTTQRTASTSASSTTPLGFAAR